MATDSATSLHQIRRVMRDPMSLTNHKHREVLQLIAKEIREQISRTGQPITFHKVKAHNGTVPNELVDPKAKAAATMDKADCDLRLPCSGKASYEHGYWLYQRSETPREEGETAMRSLDNLTHSLRAHMQKHCRLGQANTASEYYRHWQAILPQAHGQLSNTFTHDNAVTFAERRTALKYRMGCLWNNKLARRMGRSPTDLCPLCKHPDSGGHITGHCQHPTMQKMYTSRHHSTARILMRAILKGSKGDRVISADIGNQHHCTEDGIQHWPNQVPASLLPPVESAPLPTRHRQKRQKTKMQPDVMLHQGKDIYIVEFKYCRDTQPDTQHNNSISQHQTLRDQLIANGYQPENIHIIPILLGHSGTIYRTLTLDNMERLGISTQCAQKAARKMHIHAIRTLHSIVSTRRHLEHSKAPQGNLPHQPP
jgi:hypothetical protein